MQMTCDREWGRKCTFQRQNQVVESRQQCTGNYYPLLVPPVHTSNIPIYLVEKIIIMTDTAWNY